MERIPVNAYTTTGEKLATYKSLREAARECGVSVGNVSDCCAFIRRYAGGLTFRYAADSNNPPRKNFIKELKREVLAHYSHLSNGEHPVCGCCGESELSELSIDHINGGGDKHRRSIGIKSGSGYIFYRWLKQQGYPDGYQTLCIGCNLKKQKWEREIRST